MVILKQINQLYREIDIECDYNWSEIAINKINRVMF